MAILGAGGHGKVVADCAEAAGWPEIVFFDDRVPAGASVARWRIVGTGAELLERAPTFGGVLVAIGDNRTRLRWQERLEQAGAAMASVVHPHAAVSKGASVGQGSLVAAGAVVNIDASIGAASIVNTGATVDHDCVLEDGVHISPGAHLGGQVVIRRAAWIGTGASLRDQVRIGANAIVGAGAVVVADIPEGAVVVGNPARPIKGK